MRDAIETWLVEALAQYQSAGAPICRYEPILSLGIDSVHLAVLTADLAEAFSLPIESTLFYEAPTIAEAASRVAALARAETAPLGAAPIAPAESPLAIVGMSCRLPGASDLDAFWRLLLSGRRAIGPKSARRIWTEGNSAIGGGLPSTGGFLNAVDEFDAEFFRVSPAEAVEMDPQQRLLLQVVWEALDDAGLPPASLKCSETGVFIGISNCDYKDYSVTRAERLSALSTTGNALSIAANRISYALDLRGPSVAVDTACSSSLTALHFACSSLRAGECDVAIVGGVNIIIGSGLTTALHRAGMLSPSGACMPFEARADGYVRGEGCGTVVVKSLVQALSDQDRIYAVLRGTAVNQGGRAASLTAPNLLAQEALVRTACRRAGVDPGELEYVEAHGTGTPLGDPVEAAALGRVFAEGRAAGRNLRIGSVKANIGHLEAAAGIAGLIKTCLALHQGIIPGQPGFERPNPRLDIASAGLQVTNAAQSWPRLGQGVCGVSSFGFGGANAHAVLQRHSRVLPCESDARPVMVSLQAPSAEALQRQAKRWSHWLAEDGGHRSHGTLADIGDTSVFRRGRNAVTRSFVALTEADLARQIAKFTDSAALPGVPLSPQARRVVFHFPALLSPEFECDTALDDTDPLFRSAVDCAHQHRSAFLQDLPVGCHALAWERLAALQVGLCMLLRSHGIVPDGVTGRGPGRAIVSLASLFKPPDAADPTPDDIIVGLGCPTPGMPLPAWQPGLPPSHGVLQVVAALFDRGHHIRRRYVPGRSPRVVSLPPYAWKPTQFWWQETSKPTDSRREDGAGGLQAVMSLTQAGHGSRSTATRLPTDQLLAAGHSSAPTARLLEASLARGAVRGDLRRSPAPLRREE